MDLELSENEIKAHLPPNSTNPVNNRESSCGLQRFVLFVFSKESDDGNGYSVEACLLDVIIVVEDAVVVSKDDDNGSVNEEDEDANIGVGKIVFGVDIGNDDGGDEDVYIEPFLLSPSSYKI
ncbi:9503_t:CDS:2 [Entrophospora sp. SA101]|nr:18148_t:CDS:2 [Entrophospora sp. SA101]CAJ0750728.1 9503_t:CDS:2 [Entrophospora sp. SA101]